MRALFKNVDAGAIEQGGSTITQQLVKNTLSVGEDRDLKTKAREAILAMALESEMSKNQILESYLNLVYFGNRAYGVQAAAERYFSDPAHPDPLKLTSPQAALLAGLIQSPEALNPIKHPDRGRPPARGSARRDGRDAQDQQGRGRAREVGAAADEGVVSRERAARLLHGAGSPTCCSTRRPNAPKALLDVVGSTQQARANAVLKGGLKIYTAYDPYIQSAANQAMAHMPPGEFTSSLVAIDNADGGVRAIANPRPFSEQQFDPATDGSAGSRARRSRCSRWPLR